MASTTKDTSLRIYYSDPNKYRDISSNNLKASVNSAIKARDVGMSPYYAALSPLITVIEGDGTPFGIIKGQDISTKALLPGFLKHSEIKQTGNRISIDGIAPEKAQLLILNDKVEKLKRLDPSRLPNPEDVLRHYNDPRLQDSPYSKLTKEILDTIITDERNAPIKALLEPLLNSVIQERQKEEGIGTGTGTGIVTGSKR